MSDQAGLPLAVAVSAASTHDSQVLPLLVEAIPAVKSRRGPRRRKPGKLHGDKAYDQTELRRWVRDQGITVRIARTGIEARDTLGRHRWVVERTFAWLTGYRRLALRYERSANTSSPRRRTHLLQENPHMRHALIVGRYCWSTSWRAAVRRCSAHCHSASVTGSPVWARVWRCSR
ncbi:hypothetical protein GCM10027174_19700 [Salinifilum aidingensis]